MTPRRGLGAVLAVLVTLCFPALVRAQAPPASALSAQSTLEALARPLYHELAAIKGISSPGPPPPVLIRSRAETRRFIEQELDRRYSPAIVEAERKGMVAWGLIPPDYDLRGLFVDLMDVVDR